MEFDITINPDGENPVRIKTDHRNISRAIKKARDLSERNKANLLPAKGNTYENKIHFCVNAHNITLYAMIKTHKENHKNIGSYLDDNDVGLDRYKRRAEQNILALLSDADIHSSISVYTKRQGSMLYIESFVKSRHSDMYHDFMVTIPVSFIDETGKEKNLDVKDISKMVRYYDTEEQEAMIKEIALIHKRLQEISRNIYQI